MADFFNKVKKSLNKGTTTIGIKSSTMMETNKLKSEISSLKKEKIEVFTKVGEKLYNMIKEDQINLDELKDVIGRTFEIDVTIALREQDIEEVLKKQEDNLRALQDDDVSQVTEQIFCRCGAAITKETKFCPKCGMRIEHEMIEDLKEVEIQEEFEIVIEPTILICECGVEVPSDTAFCPECGKKLTV